MTNSKTKVALAIAAISLSAAAVADQKKYEVGGGATYFIFDDGFNIEDEFGLRGLIGYRVNDAWGVEFVIDQTSTETSFAGNDVDLFQAYVSGLYHYNTEGSLQPYVSAGFGQNELEIEEFKNGSTSVNIGTGLKWFLNDNLALRPSVNYFFNTEYEEDHITLGLTLSYLWGGSKSAPVAAVAAPVDSDGDGVYDNTDACPSTPAGVSVDATGCPLDSDGDGVYDYLDQCPDTAEKLKVDDEGCPIKLTETVSIELKVNFDSNSAEVKPVYYSEIRKVSDFLDQYENTAVVIEGHTDTSGAAAYNKTLSQKRADAVVKVLVGEMGVATDRVSAIGYGEEQPIADESTQAGREANRRVVAKVSTQVETMEEK